MRKPVMTGDLDWETLMSWRWRKFSLAMREAESSVEPEARKSLEEEAESLV